MSNAPAEITVPMRSEMNSTAGTQFLVRSLDWTEEQCRQWVQSWSKLCIETYMEKKKTSETSE